MSVGHVRKAMRRRPGYFYGGNISLASVMVHEGSGYSYLRCHTQDMNRSTTTDSESVCQDKRRQEEQWIPLRVEYGCTPPELELRLV